MDYVVNAAVKVSAAFVLVAHNLARRNASSLPISQSQVEGNGPSESGNTPQTTVGVEALHNQPGARSIGPWLIPTLKV